jgi:hypothetical protein
MILMILVGALMALMAGPAHATTVIPADITQLSRDAIAIVRGQVTDVSPTWTGDRRSIETLVTLEPVAYLKGELGPTVQFRIPGGRIGRFQSVTLGAPLFTVGQHVIVFLGARGPSIPYVLGLNQGLFRVKQDGDSWTVFPRPVLPTDRVGPVVRGDTSRVPLALADFERLIRTLAETRR